MKLRTLRLRNFRCYKDEFRVDFDDLTAIVGLNDAGKSSLMDALDIFLNNGTPDKDDASKGGDGKDLTIICEFDDLPASVVIDEQYPTTLGSEHLLNSANRLEVHKTYSGHLASPKCTSLGLYCVHPTAESGKDLLHLSNKDLKKRMADLGADTTGVDLKVNAQMRQSIRNSLGDLKLSPGMISLTDGVGKKVWEGLQAYLPAFALFKSDRASTDQDAEAQDPLKMAVREAIKKKQTELDALVAHVQEEVSKVAAKTLEKLQEMEPKLASELNPQLGTPNWGGLFKVSITGDDAIPINKRGSGVKRLVLLNFFRAKVELQRVEHPLAPVIYAIEEPETSQSPKHQRMLVSAFSELSAQDQVILTTHTPMLARTIDDKALRYVHVEDDDSRKLLLGGTSTNNLFAQTLGVLPDNAIKLFIGVEGVHDIAFLKGMARILLAAGVDVLDLEQMEVDGELIFFPLGGSNLALWSSKLAHLDRPEFHLYDRDEQPPKKPKYADAADVVNQRSRCKAIHTTKREMENYIHFQAVIDAYAANGTVVPLSTQWADFEDAPAIVAEALHSIAAGTNPWSILTKEEKDRKASHVKKMLNGQALHKMSKSMLDQTDPNGEVMSWFAEMKRLATLA